MAVVFNVKHSLRIMRQHRKISDILKSEKLLLPVFLLNTVGCIHSVWKGGRVDIRVQCYDFVLWLGIMYTLLYLTKLLLLLFEVYLWADCWFYEHVYCFSLDANNKRAREGMEKAEKKSEMNAMDSSYVGDSLEHSSEVKCIHSLHVIWAFNNIIISFKKCTWVPAIMNLSSSNSLFQDFQFMPEFCLCSYLWFFF